MGAEALVLHELLDAQPRGLGLLLRRLAEGQLASLAVGADEVELGFLALVLEMLAMSQPPFVLVRRDATYPSRSSME